MYKKYNTEFSTTVYREFDKTWIPINEANKDYQEYLKWVAEGNEAEEWVAE